MDSNRWWHLVRLILAHGKKCLLFQLISKFNFGFNNELKVHNNFPNSLGF